MNRETISYLSHALKDEISLVIRLHLDNDSYEVLKTPVGELGEGESVVRNGITKWMWSFADNGDVFSLDVQNYMTRTNREYLQTYFAAGKKKLYVNYRVRIQGNIYQWVSMRMIPSENYADNNQEILAYVLVNDVDADNEIKATLRRQVSILNSIAKTYFSMHIVDLEENTVFEYDAVEHIQELVDDKGNASLMMQKVMKTVVSEEDVDRALSFTELETISERMGEKNLLSNEFIGKNVGWFRATFVVVERNTAGLPSVVMFTTRVIDDEKKHEEHLHEIAHTDELTRIGNRRAYMEMLETETGSELCIVSVDVNRLKYVNDTFGHAAGDEMLRVVADYMASYVGSAGKVYRTGGDEFMMLLHADKAAVESILEKTAAALQKYIGKYVSNISLSYGYALQAEHPEYTKEQLEKEADRLMYVAKEKFYKDNNLTKR